MNATLKNIATLVKIIRIMFSPFPGKHHNSVAGWWVLDQCFSAYGGIFLGKALLARFAYWRMRSS